LAAGGGGVTKTPAAAAAGGAARTTSEMSSCKTYTEPKMDERTRKIKNAFVSVSRNLGSAQDLKLIYSLSIRTVTSSLFTLSQ
jgi:hypothetical protein